MFTKAKTTTGTVVVLACVHRRQAAELAAAHLALAGLWSSWQWGAFLGGNCAGCER